MFDIIRIGVRYYLVRHEDAPWAHTVTDITADEAEQLGLMP